VPARTHHPNGLDHPLGNTYLGCVMIAERIATKMKASPQRRPNQEAP
jgi:hypothetical protein